jgi:hypothetical protein
MHLEAGRSGSNISLARTGGKKDIFSFHLIGSSDANGKAVYSILLESWATQKFITIKTS